MGLDWELEDTNAPEAPADLQLITKEAAELKAEIAALEAETKVKKDKFGKLTSTILRTLDLMEIDSVRAHGFLFYKQLNTSVTTPKTTEDKEQLFEYLRSKGIFNEFVSVNSQTLNSLYKNLASEAAINGDLDFRLPGVGEPTSYTTLKLKKG